MAGLIRLTYWLGWVCLGLAILGRIVLMMSDVSGRMLQFGILPHNFLEGSVLFFLISIATVLYVREAGK